MRMFRLGVLFVVFTLCLGPLGCNSSGGPVPENENHSQQDAKDDLKPAGRAPVVPWDGGSKLQEKGSLGTIFVAGDDPLDVEPVLRKHFVESGSNKGSVQLIFHPENRNQFKVDELENVSNISEASDFGEIGDQIVNHLREGAPKRVLLYLEGHGAPSGSFCYHTRRHCTGSVQALMAVLNKMDQFNRTQKAGAKLEHLLIVPRSCYNRSLIAPLMSQLEIQNILTFKVSAIHMQNAEPDYSTSTAKHLAAGVIPVGPVHISTFDFRTWAKQYPGALGSKLKTLEDYLALRNDLEKWLKVEGRERLYEAKYYSPDAQPFETLLGDFDLPVLLEISLIRSGRAVRYNPYPIPNGLNHQGLLKDSIPKRLWPLVSSFQIGDQDIDLSQAHALTAYDPVGNVKFTLDLTD